MSKVELYLGDCLEIMKEIDTESIDLTVTSPPYDNLRDYGKHDWDFEGVSRELYRVTKQGGIVVWVVSDASVKGSETGTSFRQALRFMELGFNLHDTMIYERDSMPFPEVNRYEQAFQFMFVFSKGVPKTFNPIREKTRGYKDKSSSTRRADGKMEAMKYELGKEYRKRFNIWRYGAGYMKTTTDKYAFEHPAMFPELLARDHILSWSNEGDTILDCFMGSGTSGKEAVKLERNFIGIEIHLPYFEIAQQRIAEVQLQPRLQMLETKNNKTLRIKPTRLFND